MTARGWVAMAWPEAPNEADAPAAVAAGEVLTATVAAAREAALGATMVEVVEVLAEGAEARVAEVVSVQAEEMAVVVAVA